jgi:predicted RNase H-related nuclease YkuK (DUF458 family)
MNLEFPNMVWRDNSGNVYSADDVHQKLFSHVMDRDQRIHIGTDSHRSRKARHVAVATAICLWNEENAQGGWYCFYRHHIPKKAFPTLYDRLFHEAQMSVEVACHLRDNLGFDIECVHVNVNPKESEASSKYATSIKSYVEAYGFKCVLKPDDWAAGGVADKHAR